MTRPHLGLVLASLLLAAAACGDEPPEDPVPTDLTLQRAAETTRRTVQDVAPDLGDVVEVRSDTDSSCDLPDDNGSRFHSYVVAVRTRPDVERILAGDLRTRLENGGWVALDSPPGTTRFEKDGYVLMVLRAESGARNATLSVTSPCVTA